MYWGFVSSRLSPFAQACPIFEPALVWPPRVGGDGDTWGGGKSLPPGSLGPISVTSL